MITKDKIFILFVSLITSLAFAQEIEIKEKTNLPDSLIEVELDKNRFKKGKFDGYFDSNGKGIVHAGLREVKYEDMKAHMGKNDLGLIKVIEEKEILLDNTLFLYFKSEQNRAGQMFEMISYVKKLDEENVIEVGVVYPKGEEEKYKIIVEKAAISAKLKE